MAAADRVEDQDRTVDGNPEERRLSRIVVGDSQKRRDLLVSWWRGALTERGGEGGTWANVSPLDSYLWGLRTRRCFTTPRRQTLHKPTT